VSERPPTEHEPADEWDWPAALVELVAARPLSADERALLDFLLQHPRAPDELGAQAADVRVVSECNCGCHSVGLKANRSAPPAPRPDDETSSLDCYFAFGAMGQSADGLDVAVNLHVVEGYMVELEIWDGSDRPFGSPGAMPELQSLAS